MIKLTSASDGGQNRSSHIFMPQMQVQYLKLFRDVLLNQQYNNHPHLVDGGLWPPGSAAMSMAGQRRMDDMVELLSVAYADKVPGHFIETGVWRGGMSFMAAKLLELLYANCPRQAWRKQAIEGMRRVYLCDSFAGIPEQTAYGRRRGGSAAPELTQQDKFAHSLDILNKNSVQSVQRDAASMDLQLSMLRYEVGYFNETLPALVKREPELRFMVIRLDGDAYWSTYEALVNLYPRLSPGGYIIVDDYVDWPGCRAAVHLYRKEHQIDAPIILVSHAEKEEVRGAFWQKPEDPKAGAPSADKLCTHLQTALALPGSLLAGVTGRAGYGIESREKTSSPHLTSKLAEIALGSDATMMAMPIGPLSSAWTGFLQWAMAQGHHPPAQLYMCKH